MSEDDIHDHEYTVLEKRDTLRGEDTMDNGHEERTLRYLQSYEKALGN